MTADVSIRSTSNRHNAFPALAVLFVAGAFALTAIAPIAMSIGIVFLFAGPHNYVEARYFLTRLPARMGRLRTFFLLSAAGVLGLSVTLPLSVRLPGWLGWRPDSTIWLIGIWNTALILWCTWLVSIRSRQPPKKHWDYAWPIGLGAIGLAWLQPIVLPIVLVFVHPLMGLWVLDREILKSRPNWSNAYRRCLLTVPLFIALLWTVDSPASDVAWFHIPQHIEGQINHHSGAHLLTMFNPRQLIATHAFLELLHYGVWLVAVPAVSGRVFRDGFRGIPLMKRSKFSQCAISLLLAVGAVVAGVLWLAFSVDYSTTRDVYFTVATLHVLAEVPFLLRLL